MANRGILKVGAALFISSVRTCSVVGTAGQNVHSLRAAEKHSERQTLKFNKCKNLGLSQH